MRILHILDHSPPRRSDYSRRVMAILRHQRALGWKTCQLTGPAHGSPVDDDGSATAGWQFFRTAPKPVDASGRPRPHLGTQLTERLRQVVQLTRPDILHAHSPAVLAFAALRVGRRAGLPVLFEAHAPGSGSPEGASWMSPCFDPLHRHHGAARPHPPWFAAMLPSQEDSSLARFGMRTMEAWAARRAGAVVTNSEGMRQRLLQGGVPGTKIQVVPDAVEAGAYRAHGPCRIERHLHPHALGQQQARAAPAQASERWDRRMPAPGAIPAAGVRDRIVMLGFAVAPVNRHFREQGELDAEAGLHALLAALVLLSSTGAHIRLLVAGGPALHPAVYRAAARHGLAARPAMQTARNGLTNASASCMLELYARTRTMHADSCDSRAACDGAGAGAGASSSSGSAPGKLHDPAAGSLTAALHARADIVVFPQSAINSAAGPPRQLLRAMASGCIVAAANTAAHREVIEHGRNGVLFEPNDAGALADAVNVLLDAAPRWPDMRASARWLIDYHRNWESCVAMYEPIYDKLLAGRRRR